MKKNQDSLIFISAYRVSEIKTNSIFYKGKALSGQFEN
jgi:hypothetical protein